MSTTSTHNSIVNRFAKMTLATTLAITVLATALVPDANAGRKERLFFGGVAAGIVGSAIIHGAHRRHHRRDYHETSWERHVRRCYARYRSYDETTDTYINNHGYERRCRL